MGEVRSYRAFMKREGLVAFCVQHKETDLFIQAESDLSSEVSAWIIEARSAIEGYASCHPGFIESHHPLPEDPLAPDIVKQMLEAGKKAGVGPMAAVAGAIAEYVGKRLANATKGEVIVENGGDSFIRLLSQCVVGIYAGSSILSGRIGIRLDASVDQVGVCTSSGTLGHSKSFGTADAITVVSGNCALADAAATAAGNLVKKKTDVEYALDFLRTIEGVDGAVVVKQDVVGAFGNFELVAL